jgi:hypothetical protein
MEQAVTPHALTFNIVHQERYSRLELLLRSFFGILYIAIPHLFLLFFMSIAALVLGFIAWWAVLFTGKYPRSLYDFQLGLLRWNTRLSARLLNLADGYPAFGNSAIDEQIVLDIPYPENLSRLILVVRLFFGGLYVLIPHGFCLFFRGIATYVVIFIAWWAVLFTGKYPKGMHDFVVGTLRWSTRVNVYMSFLTDTYPPFSGK